MSIPLNAITNYCKSEMAEFWAQCRNQCAEIDHKTLLDDDECLNFELKASWKEFCKKAVQRAECSNIYRLECYARKQLVCECSSFMVS